MRLGAFIVFCMGVFLAASGSWAGPAIVVLSFALNQAMKKGAERHDWNG
jgi:hypothetical protein